MAVLLVALTLGNPGLPAAQTNDDLRDLIRETARRQKVGESVQSLIGFAAFPGVSAANFTIDETADNTSDAKTVKFLLPLAHEFQGPSGLPARIYSELTLGYLEIDESFDNILPGIAFESSVDNRIQAFPAIGGAGLAFDPFANTTVRPIALFGYLRIRQRSDLSGSGADNLEAVADSILNYDVNQALYGGAIEVAHQRSLVHDLNLTTNIRYNHLFVEGFGASDSIYETSSNFGVLTGLAELDGPTGLSVAGRRLRWIAYSAGTYLTGTESDAYDFDYFVELGGGLEIVDRSVVEGVEGISLRGSTIVGNGITGWSIYAHIEF